MVITFDCTCGNKDPKKTYFYDGSLGYEATICTCCGRYYDMYGEQEADKFSKLYLNRCNQNE